MAGNVVSLRGRVQNPRDPETLVVKISTSSGHQGRVANKVIKWPALCEKLSETNRDSVSLKEYLAQPIAWQDKRKNQGFFVGGQFEGGARKLHALESRTLLTFDVDNCTPPLLADLTLGFSWLGDYEYFIYSTRKHTPEAPRVRIVVPVQREVSVAEYGPLARIIAQRIDSEMRAVDPVSFRPAQIMYWPSTCRGAEFIGQRNAGPLLDAAAVLADFGHWEDYTKLPRSPRERDLRATADKAHDPTEKRGIVGAFCRAYDIHGAIEEFLPGRYVEGTGSADGNERYSFVGGSTTNGAVIYEGGKFLYSYHGTDPCSDRLVNAFDLVRIHLYGELDKFDETLEGAPSDPRNMPSYQAMQESLAHYKLVVAELRDGLYDADAMADDFETDDDDEPSTAGAAVRETFDKGAVAAEGADDAEAPAKDTDWKDRLDVTGKGIIRTTLMNVAVILDNDARFRGALGYNEFLQEPVMVRRIGTKQYGYDTGNVRNRENGDYLSGEIEGVIRAILEAPHGEGKTGYGLKVADRDLRDGITIISHAHKFHPVQRYLQGCAWDGKPRFTRLFVDYFHARNTSYHRATAFLWMVAAVARAFEPGCKFDFVPIIEGPQGIRKSTGLQVLAGAARFGELRASFHDVAKLVEDMQGKWLMEIPELAQFRRGEAETMKTFFSARQDRVRLAYGRGAKDYLRQQVFAGTTNNKEYLKDPTGARRYWPIELTGATVDTEGLESDRDLLWGEAYQTYLYMRRLYPDLLNLPLYLNAKVTLAAQSIQASRMEVNEDDILTGQVKAWLDDPVNAQAAVVGYRPDAIEGGDGEEGELLVQRTTTCIKDVLFYVLGKGDHEVDYRLSRQLGRVLSQLSDWRLRRNVLFVSRKMGNQKVYDRFASATDTM